jgi:hypothetical protein
MLCECAVCSKKFEVGLWRSMKRASRFCSFAHYTQYKRENGSPLKGRTLTEEHRNKVRIATLVAMRKPEMREKMSCILKEINNRPDILEKNRLRGLGKKQSDATKQKRSASLKGHQTSIETRRKIGNKNKIYMKKKAQDPEWLKQRSNQLKKLWADPVYYEKQRKAILSKLCARPNYFESRIGAELNALFPSKFKYVGDGSVLIGGKSPDFISEDLKTIVLCNGLYFHLYKFGLSNTLEDKRKIEIKEASPFNNNGYDVWFVWEDSNVKERKEYKVTKEVIWQ